MAEERRSIAQRAVLLAAGRKGYEDVVEKACVAGPWSDSTSPASPAFLLADEEVY